MLCKGESEMPDSEELEKKEKREFMRETIVKPPLTRKQIAKRVALFVCASAVFGGVAAVSFAAVKPFADRCFQENGMQETSSVEFSKDDPDSVSPSDGADADMTAQPEQMEQEIDEAVSEALSSYQFSADNFNSMTSVLRGIGEQGDKSIVTVSSGKQDTDIFGNPVENTGDYAGAVIAESDGEFLIFTYADAVRAADSINVRFSDGTKIAGTVRQIDEVLGMAVVAVPSGNLPEEERKKVQVLSLANSYTVKAGDVLVGIGAFAFVRNGILRGAQCADYRWTDADPVCGYQQQFADGYLFDQYSRRDGRLDIGVLPQRELYGSDGGVHHFQLQADSGAADEWRFGGISGHPGTGCEPCDAGERHSGGRLRDGGSLRQPGI